MKQRKITVSKPDLDDCVYVKAFSEGGTEIGRLAMCPTTAILDTDGARSIETMRVGFVNVVGPFKRRGVATQLYQAAAHEACKSGRRLQADFRQTSIAQQFWEKQLHKGRAQHVWSENWGHGIVAVLALKCPAPKSLAGARKNTSPRRITSRKHSWR